jgi:hypothetical protein
MPHPAAQHAQARTHPDRGNSRGSSIPAGTSIGTAEIDLLSVKPDA